MKVTFLLLLMIGGCSLLPVNGNELSGVVKAESGKPLPDVRILTYAPTEKKAELLGFPLTSQRYETATDQNGFFKLPSHGRIVYFKRSDLRPITKLMDLSAARIVVVMEDGAPYAMESAALLLARGQSSACRCCFQSSCSQGRVL